MSTQSGNWIPLVDYAALTGKSMSTLRRYIKSNKIEHKQEKGRYLLYYKGDDHFMNKSDQRGGSAESKIEWLEKDLRKANNEIAELKTLIALYEERYPQPFDT